MHTRHFAVIALGAIGAAFGVTGQEYTDSVGLVAALISALGIQDVIKGWVQKHK